MSPFCFAPARAQWVLRAMRKLNGVVIQRDVTCTGPTRGGKEGEVAEAPFSTHGNHGPVALRNIWVRDGDW